jgi:hypothetical protein
MIFFIESKIEGFEPKKNKIKKTTQALAQYVLLSMYTGTIVII